MPLMHHQQRALPSIFEVFDHIADLDHAEAPIHKVLQPCQTKRSYSSCATIPAGDLFVHANISSVDHNLQSALLREEHVVKTYLRQHLKGSLMRSNICYPSLKLLKTLIHSVCEEVPGGRFANTSAWRGLHSFETPSQNNT